PHRMPVKYNSEVPPASTMASSLFSAMSRRALSMRAARSSFVIGFARSRIDVNAAMLGGTGVLSAAAARPRCAERRRTGDAAGAPAIDRNDRRENISSPGLLSDHIENDVGCYRCSVHSRPFRRRRLRHQCLDRLGPTAVEQVLLRNVAAAQKSR